MIMLNLKKVEEKEGITSKRKREDDFQTPRKVPRLEVTNNN